LLSVIFVLIFAPIYASGKKDITLAEIDELIENKDLNEAVDKLDDYIKYNPEDFDNAQKRVEQILKTREYYKEVADELVEFQEYLKANPLENTPENNKKILDYIAELQSMENNQNPQQLKFIAQLKDAAQFIYCNSVFEQIMEAGISLNEEKKYTEAARKYTEGFTLYRDDFYTSGYDKKVVTNVDNFLNKINSDLSEYENLQAQIQDVFNRYIQALDEGSFSKAEKIYSEIDSIISKIALIRNNTAKSGMYLKNSFEEKKAANDGYINDSSFLPFAYRFILGKDSDTRTGILAAIDTQWETLINDSKTHFTAALEKKYTEIASQIPSSSLSKTSETSETIKSQLANVSEIISMGKKLNLLYLKFNEAPRGFTSDSFPVYTNALVYGDVLKEQSLKLLEISNNVTAETKIFSVLSAPKDATAFLRNTENAYTVAVLQYLSKLSEFKNSSQGSFSIVAENRQLQDDTTLVKQMPWENMYICLDTLNATIQTYTSDKTVATWTELASVIANGSTEIANSYTDVINKATAFINEPLSTDVPSYPDKALDMLNATSESSQTDLALLQEKVQLLKTAPQDALFAISEPIKIAENGVTGLTAFSKTKAVKIALATQRINKAELSQNEAELRLAQANNYMNTEEFDRARDSLQRAREKFSESLLYKDSDVLRTSSDTRLQSLGSEITRLENEQVVRLVRSLKTKAKDAYYQGNFEVAENILVEARSKWSTTNVDTDSEIEDLMALVNTAISMKTGRVIYPTDPLYSEMSQILNIANQYYTVGYDLIKKGERTEALSVLEKAKTKLRDLQIVYPLNQQASLLTLRIDKLVNPESFDEFFKQKYEAAKTDYQNSAKQQQAYIDLLDLYEINPSYPGLKEFIYKVEIALGIRIPPPNRVAIANSLRLTSEAQSLYDKNRTDEIVLNQALVKLDEAIKLDGDNEKAAILKDRINTALGGQAIVVLPAAQQAIYQQAIQALQKGNLIEAAAFVAKLWEDPNMRRSPDVIDLKNKVDSQL
jgi:hypothetical protein